MVVAYHGAPFRGYAANEGVRTVAGDLGAALARLLRTPVELTGAGRTDAGVHAWGQVVSFPFDLEGAGFSPDQLRLRLNRLLAPAIVVREVSQAEPSFDARFSARSRRYRYSVLARPVPDPFLADTTWFVPQPLDLACLRLACDPFIGEHDFSSFCRRIKDPDPEQPPSMHRRVLDARWETADDGLLHLWIEANAFCHQMVRSIVGTMVDVGIGRRHAGQITGMLAARDRNAAGTVAPPHGLCLWEVRY